MPARGRLRRSPARDPDPRLLHRRERAHHARHTSFVGTTHKPGPMNLSVKQAARALIHDGQVTEGSSTGSKWRCAPTTRESAARRIAWTAITAWSITIMDAENRVIQKWPHKM